MIEKLIHYFNNLDWKVDICLKHKKTKYFNNFINILGEKVIVFKGVKKADNKYVFSFGKDEVHLFNKLDHIDIEQYNLTVRNKTYDLLEGTDQLIIDFIKPKSDVLEYLFTDSIKERLDEIFNSDYSLIFDKTNRFYKVINSLKVNLPQSNFDYIPKRIKDHYLITYHDVVNHHSNYMNIDYCTKNILTRIKKEWIDLIDDLQYDISSSRSKVKYQQRLDYLLGLNKFFLLNITSDNKKNIKIDTINKMFNFFDKNKLIYINHYDVYGSSVKLIKDWLFSFQEYDISTLIRCLDFLLIGKISTRFAQEKDFLYWSSTKKCIPYNYEFYSNLKFPKTIDYYCSFWHIKRVLNHLFFRLEASLKLSSNIGEIMLVFEVINNLQTNLPDQFSYEINLSFKELLMVKLINNYQFDKAIALRDNLNIKFTYYHWLLDFWEENCNNSNIQQEIVKTLYEDISMKLRFEIGNLWELFCLKYLEVKFNTVSSDINNETTLVSKKRPDFITGSISRATNNLVIECDVIWDAKKSVDAINDEIKEYLPSCKKLVFLVLEGEEKNMGVIENIQYVYGTDIYEELKSKHTQLIEDYEQVKYLSDNFYHILENRLNIAMNSINTNFK